MDETGMWWLAGAGLTIIAILMTVAGRLLWLVHSQEQRRREQLAMMERQSAAQRERLNESVRLLARAFNAGQVDLAETAIRISVLLDALAVDDAVRDEFAVFWQVADRLRHIPTHNDWQALEKVERTRYRREMDTLEEQFGSFAQDAARKLANKGQADHQ